MGHLGKIASLLANGRGVAPFAASLRSTFAQYGEDQVFRLLLQPGDRGTYLDVGSHHPTRGSNTYNLYLRGWRGVTVDPNPAFADPCRRYRPGDAHLVEGVAGEAGAITYFEFADTVYNTLSPDRARDLERMGIAVVGRRTVRCRPLRAIVEERLAGRQIDLLSVDCEGLDLEAIASLDLARHRPTVMMVEDFQGFAAFRGGGAPSALSGFLHGNGYRPIAQLAFSALFVATDWEQLFARSGAYRAERIQGGILP